MASEPHLPIQVKDQIHLTEKESLIFQRLKGVLHHFNLDTQLRVAGGWVRDKRFGTPEEDAYRRDLTINSLFYNINSDSVEDFTGRGITDLKSGKIVTPLPPKETFLDDPLRVLRAIRFGARFCFVLDEGLKEAAASDEVRDAIKEKISRERIGHEVDLMIGGNEPVKAVTYIRDLQLFWIVFNVPSNVEPSLPEECDRFCLAFMDTALRLIQSLESLNLNDEQRRLCLYSALFLPLRSMVYRDNKKKKVPVVDFIFRNSLKLKSKDAETVSSDSLGLMILLRLCLLLREIKDFWPVALLVSTLLYPNGDLCESLAEDLKLEKNRALFKQVKDVILKLDLENIWEAKPLVNGKDIMSILNLKAGPNVKEWQQKVIEWQLAHPTGTADECQEWLREAGAKRARMDDNV
uniref:Poly A polymerase head domain-containing protein n=1 Tax=Chenopodium quinoa TaxID=63459 RepID=A0A803L025_CHEQI